MNDDSTNLPDEALTSVERLLARVVDDDAGIGRPLSDRARRAQRSVEAYLKAGGRPRWMDRVMEIDRAIAAEKKRLEREYAALREEVGRDPELFAQRWRAVAESRSFDELNALIREHNEWYPVERDLPMNPRTGEYVLVSGRPYQRPVLGATWVLEHFPAVPLPW